MSESMRCLLAVWFSLAAATFSYAQLPGGLPIPLPGADPGSGNDFLDVSCQATQSTGCGDQSRMEHIDICFDADQDNICDELDECPDTPPNTPVFFNGCHLQQGKAMVLRGVNFEFDRADLTLDSRPILERAVEVLQAQKDVYVTVDGHTDSLGSDAYNLKLSWSRVRSVYAYFLREGIDPARLAFRGFGEFQPIAPNMNEDGSDNPAGRAANRRVELNVLDDIAFLAIKETNRGRFDDLDAAKIESVWREPDRQPATAKATPVAEQPKLTPKPVQQAEKDPPAEQKQSTIEDKSDDSGTIQAEAVTDEYDQYDDFDDAYSEQPEPVQPKDEKPVVPAKSPDPEPAYEEEAVSDEYDDFDDYYSQEPAQSSAPAEAQPDTVNRDKPAPDASKDDYEDDGEVIEFDDDY